MPKKNMQSNELVEESHISEEDVEDEFDGPVNSLALENDDEFDDCWHPEIEDPQHLSAVSTTPKFETSIIATIDKKNIQKNIPPKFICALSKQIMLEPVRIAGSKVPLAYEKSAIEAYYEEHGEDPMTHEDLGDDAHFIPDLALKREISDFCLAHTLKSEKATA